LRGKECTKTAAAAINETQPFMKTDEEDNLPDVNPRIYQRAGPHDCWRDGWPPLSTAKSEAHAKFEMLEVEQRPNNVALNSAVKAKITVKRSRSPR
jgi:hypothetical protein